MMADTEQSGEFIIIWKIENFNFNTVKFGECLKSPEFELQAFNETSWFLEFHPRGKLNYHNFCSCCSLCRTQIGPEKIDIIFKIDLISKDGSLLATTDCFNRTYTRGKEFFWGWNKYFDNVNDPYFSTITVRCSLSRPDSRVELITKCSAVTKIGADQHCCIWNVEIFSNPSWTESKIIPCSQAQNIEVTLSAPNDIMNISVKQVKNILPQIIACKLSLLDVKGIELHSKRYAHFFTAEDSEHIWKFPSFITKVKLMGEKSKCLKHGFFTLIFEFSLSNGKILQGIEGYFQGVCINKEDFVTTDAITGLKEDLQWLYTKQLHTDVTLRGGNKTYQAHKLLLSARSPVFAAMFERDMLEKQTDVVEIPDVEAKILDCFLAFLYTGTVDNLDYEFASKLLIIADKYQVPSLVEMCSSFLISNLTIENACDVVMVAYMVGHETLKVHTLDYVATHAETILSSDHWARCIENNIKLATDVICKISVKLVSK